MMKNILQMFKTYFLSLLATLKHWFIAAASVFTAFVGPIGDLIYFVSLLVVIDFVSGVTAAHYRGEVRQSSKMVKSVYKIIFYMLALLMAQLFDAQMHSLINPHLTSIFLDADSMENLTKFKFLAALSFIIIIRELKSIDENWGAIFSWSFISTGTLLYNQFISFISLLKPKK